MGLDCRVQNSGPLSPSFLRVSSQRASAFVALEWKPRVVAFSPLPCSTRISCFARNTSDGRSASASEIRRPLRYSSVSSARLRMPVGARVEHRQMTAWTSSGVSTSAGYRCPARAERHRVRQQF